MNYTSHAIDLDWPIQICRTSDVQVFPGTCLNKKLKDCLEGEKVYRLVLDVSGLKCPHSNDGLPTREDGFRVLAYSYIQFPILPKSAEI